MTDYSHMHTHTYVHILIASWNIEVKYLQRVKKNAPNASTVTVKSALPADSALIHN